MAKLLVNVTYEEGTSLCVGFSATDVLESGADEMGTG